MAYNYRNASRKREAWHPKTKLRWNTSSERQGQICKSRPIGQQFWFEPFGLLCLPGQSC